MSVSSNTIEAEDSGLRLDRWFKRRYPALGHTVLEKMLRTGQVRLDGKRAKASDRVETGQVVRLPPLMQNLPPPPVASEAEAPKESDQKFIESLIMHEDEALFVLNKPSGLATQGGSGIRRHVDGLLIGLQRNKRNKPRLVHRLDRDTSGVLVVARTQPAAAALSESLRRRDAQKIYWALTIGVPSPRRGVISLALAKESGFGQHGRDERMTTLDKDEAEETEGAKSASTHYAVIGTAADKYAFVALKPVTGRTHQIRAHLAAIGTPIVGDFKYGGVEAKGLGELEDRLHLHARSMDIAHPLGGRLQAQAPLASHMAKAWDLFGFNPDESRNPFGEHSAREERPHRGERDNYPTKGPKSRAKGRGAKNGETKGWADAPKSFDPRKLSKRDPWKRNPGKQPGAEAELPLDKQVRADGGGPRSRSDKSSAPRGSRPPKPGFGKASKSATGPRKDSKRDSWKRNPERSSGAERHARADAGGSKSRSDKTVASRDPRPAKSGFGKTFKSEGDTRRNSKGDFRKHDQERQPGADRRAGADAGGPKTYASKSDAPRGARPPKPGFGKPFNKSGNKSANASAPGKPQRDGRHADGQQRSNGPRPNGKRPEEKRPRDDQRSDSQRPDGKPPHVMGHPGSKGRPRFKK